MNCSLMRYPSKEADKARIYLTKNDYLKISEYIESLLSEKFSLSEPVNCRFSYRHDGFEASYNTEEFIKNFSPSSKFMELTISAYVPFEHSMILFYTNCNNYGGIHVYMKSDCHTQAELEDALEALIAYVESLILAQVQKNNQLQQSFSNKKRNQGQQCGVADTANPANHPSSPSAPLYKNGTFWGAIGAIGTLISIIVAIILK